MSRYRDDTPSPFELSKKTPVKTNLGVLIAIVGAAFLGAAAWVHVEFTLTVHEKALATQATVTDAISALQKADHDILIRLDQRTEWLGHNKTSAIIAKPSVTGSDFED